MFPSDADWEGRVHVDAPANALFMPFYIFSFSVFFILSYCVFEALTVSYTCTYTLNIV